MGEAGASAAPFQFFTDHHGELADAVREGRRREFASFAAFSDPARRAQIPDPNAAETFHRSCPISHAECGDARRAFYRRLLALRRAHLVPCLEGATAIDAVPIGPSAVLARWRLGDGAVWTLACNLGAEPCTLARPAGDVIFETADGAAGSANGQLAGRTTIAFLEPSRG
jgi:1,4-alpha-glucan branching enzyme